jgi:hypothetical protein
VRPKDGARVEARELHRDWLPAFETFRSPLPPRADRRGFSSACRLDGRQAAGNANRSSMLLEMLSHQAPSLSVVLRLGSLGS